MNRLNDDWKRDESKYERKEEIVSDLFVRLIDWLKVLSGVCVCVYV